MDPNTLAANDQEVEVVTPSLRIEFPDDFDLSELDDAPDLEEKGNGTLLSGLGSFMPIETEASTFAQWSKFWQLLGEEQADFSESQINIATDVHELRPNSLTVTYPLDPTLDERKGWVEQLNKLQPNVEPKNTWAMDASGVYGKLLQGLDVLVTEGGHDYELRYQLPTGDLVERKEYLAFLSQYRQCARGKDGRLWGVSVIDTGEPSKQSPHRSVADLYNRSTTTFTPVGALFALHLWQQAHGINPAERGVDLSNESICLSNDRIKASHVQPIGVSYDSDGFKIGVVNWYRDANEARCRVRDAVSGLGLQVIEQEEAVNPLAECWKLS